MQASQVAPAKPAPKLDESYMPSNPYDMYQQPKGIEALASSGLGMSGTFDIERDDTFVGTKFQ